MNDSCNSTMSPSWNVCGPVGRNLLLSSVCSESLLLLLTMFPIFAHFFLIVIDLVVCCMDVGTSSCLLKKIVGVNINSKWSAVILASIISWSEVLIRGIEIPIAFEVEVQWVFSELVADGSLKNCLDLSKVDSSFIECLVPHPRDQHSLLKAPHPLTCSPI